MGIKNLYKILRSKCPDCFEQIHLSEYRFKKIAVDFSLYLCQYKVRYGDEGWLQAFIRLVSCLRENDIHCVFIFDSLCPPEKQDERKNRVETQKKTDERICTLEQALEAFHENGTIDPVLIEFQKKRKISPPRLIRPQTSSTINIAAIESAVEKMRKCTLNITDQDFKIARTLFKIFDVPYYHAPVEAETMCADLCLQGCVDAVLSEDTDVLAYGTPTFISKINVYSQTCIRIQYEKLLIQLGLTHPQFLDMCIMCGTDYNRNIPRIGPMKAYEYITKYKSIEGVRKHTDHDISVLKHIRTRELFREYAKSKVRIAYCGVPDFSDLELFLFKKNINVDLETLKKAFVPQPARVLVMDDEKDEKTKQEINGLTYVKNFISDEEADELISRIDEEEWDTQLKRRVQQYGYRYDYKSRTISEKIGTLPSWCKFVINRLIEEKFISAKPDQLIVNEYTPGTGISPHIDSDVFDDEIVSVSLLSACMMTFEKDGEDEKHVWLEPNSALILESDVRHVWKHGITGKKFDMSPDGHKILRKRRVSLTFRKVKK